jgi:hypothetical protein
MEIWNNSIDFSDTPFNSTSTQLLANVMATVENMKKEIITKNDLAQTT